MYKILRGQTYLADICIQCCQESRREATLTVIPVLGLYSTTILTCVIGISTHFLQSPEVSFVGGVQLMQLQS